jgi:hypothetical protein
MIPPPGNFPVGCPLINSGVGFFADERIFVYFAALDSKKSTRLSGGFVHITVFAIFKIAINLPLHFGFMRINKNRLLYGLKLSGNVLRTKFKYEDDLTPFF